MKYDLMPIEIGVHRRIPESTECDVPACRKTAQYAIRTRYVVGNRTTYLCVRHTRAVFDGMADMLGSGRTATT